MDPKESRSGSSGHQDWQGPHTVVVPRLETGLGFTLRHFVVYPPPSVLDESRSEQDYDLKGERPSLHREVSLEPQDTIFVKSVKTGSAAHAAGLCTGDRIVAVNGDSINGKSYGEVIALIQNSPKNLKLLVVPKDDDILQMAYQSAGDPMYNSSSSLSDNSGHTLSVHQPPADDYLPYEYMGRKSESHHPSQHNPYKRYATYNPLETDPRQWNNRVANSLSDLSNSDRLRSQPTGSTDLDSQSVQELPPSLDTSSNVSPQPSQMSQDLASKMTSPSIACNIPSKTKYSFGLYFPPKSKASQHVGSAVGVNRVASTTTSQGSLSVDSGSKGDKSQNEAVTRRLDTPKVRKASLDESSTSLSTARAKEYFIRYSANKSASDARQRYASRHSAYERTPVEKPTYVISRSQTVSTISPAHTQRSSLSGSIVRHSVEIPARTGSEDSLDTKFDPIAFYSQPSGVSKQTDNRTGTNLEGSPLRGGRTTKSQGDLSANNNGGRRTFVVRIPYDQQRQQSPQISEANSDSKQMYGTTFAVTRSPAITRVEIQKTVGMPIVSHRKHLFESGQNENNPPTFHNGPQNRYKSEIERIRTQPKFSSIATRMASFEQSPDRDPSGSESEEKGPGSDENVSASMDTAQPTIKVRKISTERHSPAIQLQTSGSTESSTTIIRGGFSEPTPIHIYVSSNGASTQSAPIVEIVSRQIPPDNAKQSMVRNDSKVPQNISQGDHCSSPSLSSTSSGVTVESGSWSKSYDGSSDMIDGTSSMTEGSVVDYEVVPPPSRQAPKPARKTSYLTAVNAPRTTPSGIQDGRGVHTQPPQPMFAQSHAVPHKTPISPSPSSSSLHTGPPVTLEGPPPSSHPQGRPYSVPQSKVIVASHPPANEMKGHPAFPSSVSANSLSSVISETSTTSLTPAVMSASDSAIMPMDRDPHHLDTIAYGSNNYPVQMRRKPIDTYEDQANKLHRRTSYLMATARDRTNTVPIEKAFCSQPIVEQSQSAQPAVSQSSSAKLNKFFGEKIPSIAEGLESRVEEEEPPEIIRKGPLFCKISVWENKKCSDRSWKQVYAILKPTELFLTRDKESSTSSNFEDHHVPLQSYMVEFARDYAKKKKNVFRLTTHDECVYLFHAEDRGTTLCWFQAIKGINEPDKNETSGAPEQTKHLPVEINIIPANKASPPMGHKSKKLSALSLKAKLASSPSMRRKKSNASEKDKEEVVVKKSWKGRIPMMKSLRKHSEDVILPVHLEPVVDGDSIRQFGVHLEDCFPSPHNEFVPLIVELCTRIVEARGLEVIGVYRVPGNSAAINALTEEFNNGIDNVNIDNEKLLDINVISSLLKSFFRKLPEPLVNSENYDAFIEANRNPDPDKRMLKLKRLLHLLPPHHNETFKHMAEHLYKVASYGNINKMDAKNLALMFGPTLIRKTEDDTVSLVTDMSDQCRIIESIILHYEWFFSPWDQDNHIPMETTVETVLPDEGHGFKDDDEEADSAISTKEIISSIVGAASRKLRNQQQKSEESLVDGRISSLDTLSLDKRGLDTSSHLSTLSKSETSLTSTHSAEDGLSQSTFSSIPKLSTAPIAHSEPDSLDLEFADATSPSVSSLSHHFSSDSLLDKNDELEISHGQATSMSRDAIHNTLKRIGNDVYTLLQTFEQKQLKERERRRREQEQIEREHQRTQLELEEDEIHSIDDWLAIKAAPSRMPDVVSSSYIGETYPYGGYGSPTLSDNERKERIEKDRRIMKSNQSNLQSSSKSHHSRHGSFDSVPSRSPYGSSFDEIVPDNNQRAMMSKSASQSKPPDMRQKNIHLAVDKQHLRPSSIRNSMGHRHGSLDSLIDLIDKRSSWASSDSEDGADLLTSLTTTFDQKLKILVNPKYKLTGMSGRKHFRNESGIPATLVSEAKDLKDSSAPLRPVEGNKHPPLPATFVESDRPFRDPSLHRSSKPDAKIGIASRFERNDNRALSSSPVMNVQEPLGVGRNSKKGQAPDFRSFLGRSSVHSPRESGTVVLTQPRKLDDSGIIVLRSINKSRRGESQRSYSKSEKTEMNLARLSKEGKGLIEAEEGGKQDNKENEGKRKSDKRQGVRRHTVGGTEDFEHIDALVQVCSNEVSASAATGEPRPSAWDQLQPLVKDSSVPGDRSLQAWLHRERMRGSTPDLSAD